ncbi:MAG: hypothetical protein M3R72_02985 [Bacteroidota bacterium]|nr:hypothetical protein [Bacteroidota bacterium]
MFYKAVFFLFVLMPFVVMAQASSPRWSLFLNETKLASASMDSAASVQLSKKKKGNLKMVFENRDSGFRRTILLMNEKRQTFLQKAVKTKSKTASFLMKDVLEKSKQRSFVMYVVDVPEDSTKAMGIRMMPVAICKVKWK